MAFVKLLIALVCLIAAPPGQNAKPLSARDYYNELLKASALEKPSTYACFSDKEDGNFWTLARLEAKDLPKPFYDKLPKETQGEWDRGFIHHVEYWKGVPTATDYLRDGDSWVSKSEKKNGSGVAPTVFTITISINWKTMRYVRPPVNLCTGATCSIAGDAESGRCEAIPTLAPLPEKK
jgi:hypothetical protein